MKKAALQVMYVSGGDGIGEVFATVKSGAFSAEGSAWFGRGLEDFLRGLRSYPLSSENPPMIEDGFWDGKGGLDRCHLRISVKPYNSRGTLLVHVELASEVRDTPDVDLQNSASIRFLTEYAAVDRFAAELEQILDSKRAVAVLEGILD
jgi:hypothetical protein